MLETDLIRKKMQCNQASIGSWMQLPNADVAEIMGRAGYDWVAVDLEHGAITRRDLPDIFRAIEGGGTLPFARVADCGMTSIKIALDSGARGLIFPMIEDRSMIDDAISLSYYPPKGKRGVGFCRANLYGKAFGQSLTTIRDTFFCAQIESIHAVNSIDEIIDHPKLDAIMVGPYDLSGSMGLTGQFTHPDFVAVMDCIRRKANEQGVPMGLHVVQPDPESLANKIKEGYRFIAYGIDATFLYHSAECPTAI